MKKKIPIICSIVSIMIVLLLGFMYYRYAMRQKQVLYVAKHQLSQRSQINEDDLERIEVSKQYTFNDIYVDLNDILGKYVKLSYTIPKGSFIYKTSIESDIGDYANTLLSSNEVNYDLFINDIKINTANIKTNMYIDLYLTINSKDKLISDLLIANARVTGLYDNNNKLIPDYDKDSRVSIVSIAIDKECVNILNKAQIIGELDCVINSSSYDTNLKTKLNSNSIIFEYLE